MSLKHKFIRFWLRLVVVAAIVCAASGVIAFVVLVVLPFVKALPVWEVCVGALFLLVTVWCLLNEESEDEV